MNTDTGVAFTERTAPRPDDPNPPKPPRKRSVKKKAARKPARRAAAAAKTPRRQGAAPLMVNAEAMFAAAGTMKKKDMAAVHGIVALLNPLPRKARLRALQAVQTILA